MVHQFGGDARVLQIFLDEFGVFLVDLLRRWSGWCASWFSFFGLAEGRTGSESEGKQRAAERKAA